MGSIHKNNEVAKSQIRYFGTQHILLIFSFIISLSFSIVLFVSFGPVLTCVSGEEQWVSKKNLSLIVNDRLF